MASDLKGKVAIVTGGSSGMGRASALALAERGASIVVAARSAARGQEVVNGLTSAGRDALFVETDVSSVGSCRALVRRTVEALGRVDILVNCAGTWSLASALEVTEEEWDRQFAVNVKGAFFCAQAVIPQMVERGSGKIINIASVASFAGFPGASLYCATKGALATLTKALATEFAASGVNINSIAPGNVETPFNAHLMADPDHYKTCVDNTPAGRNGKPEDIAPAVVFLASDESSYMHGACMIIDGGWLAR